MDLLLYLGMSCILLLIIVPVIMITVKTIRKRKLPSNYYTPFDYISAQTNAEFHEEKEETKEDNENGDKKIK